MMTTGASGVVMTVEKIRNGAISSKIGTDMNELASLAVGAAAPTATRMPLYIKVETINIAILIANFAGSMVTKDKSRVGKSR